MADEPVQSMGEMMIFGLMEQADRIGRPCWRRSGSWRHAPNSLPDCRRASRRRFAELAAERVALGTMANYAAKAMREAIDEGNRKIEGETQIALRQPSLDIQQASHHVRENVKETRWLVIAAYITLGMVLGLALGYMPVRSDLNALTEHVNRINGYLAAQQPQTAAARQEEWAAVKNHNTQIRNRMYYIGNKPSICCTGRKDSLYCGWFLPTTVEPFCFI